MRITALVVGFAVLLTGCGGSGQGEKESKRTKSSDPLEAYESEAQDLALILQKCAQKDGEACFKLGKHFEEQAETAGLPDALKDVTLRQAQANYKASCDYGHTPACKVSED